MKTALEINHNALALALALAYIHMYYTHIASDELRSSVELMSIGACVIFIIGNSKGFYAQNSSGCCYDCCAKFAMILISYFFPNYPF